MQYLESANQCILEKHGPEIQAIKECNTQWSAVPWPTVSRRDDCHSANIASVMRLCLFKVLDL